MKAKVSSGEKKRKKAGEGILFVLFLLLLLCQLKCYKNNKKNASLKNEGLP